jgi:small conductance mechanosensitive channel
MDVLSPEGISSLVTNYLIPGALKVAGAIALWVIGGWIIGWLQKGLRAVMEKDKVDPSLVRYADSALGVALRLFLVIAILGQLGVQTTSFAALIAAVGLAIGAAWSGLLGHFAAGIFLLVLRPFRIGDLVSAGGVTGRVKEIGMFTTTIDTAEGVRNYVGNGKVFADNIANYSANPHRRVELTADIDHSVDPNDAMAQLRAAIANVPNVLTDPAPVIEVLGFPPTGTQLAVRPYCKPEHYWQVYFATNKMIVDTFSSAKYPPGQQHVVVRNLAA